MKKPPTGLGIWCAYKPTNPAVRCVEIGASWVAPRAGFDAWNDPGCRVSDMQAYRQAGLGIYPWLYVTPEHTDRIVDAAKHILETGYVDGLILDPEIEFVGRQRDAAELVRALRAALPDVFIAYAPFDNRASFPEYPWTEFDALDAAMPQVYSWEHDDRGSQYWLPHVMEQWRACPIPVWPVGCTYRPKIRGGHPTPPLSDSIVAADVGWFVDQRPAGVPWSLYSLEAAPVEVIEALVERAVPRHEPLPAYPDTAATPLGWADRAERDLEDNKDTSPQTPAARLKSGKMRTVRPSEASASETTITLVTREDDDDE